MKKTRLLLISSVRITSRSKDPKVSNYTARMVLHRSLSASKTCFIEINLLTFDRSLSVKLCPSERMLLQQVSRKRDIES